MMISLQDGIAISDLVKQIRALDDDGMLLKVESFNRDSPLQESRSILKRKTAEKKLTITSM